VGAIHDRWGKANYWEKVLVENLLSVFLVGSFEKKVTADNRE